MSPLINYKVVSRLGLYLFYLLFAESVYCGW